MYKKGSYIAARIVGLLIVAIMGCIYAVQTPFVQTKLSKIAIERFTTAFDGTISCEELSILPSGALLMRDVLVLDSNPYDESDLIDSLAAIKALATASTKIPKDSLYQSASYPRPLVDTLFYAKQITATFTLGSIIDGKGMHFGKVKVDDATMNLTTEPTLFLTNITRIFNIAPQEFQRPPEINTFYMRKVELNRFRFRLTNFQRNPYNVAIRPGRAHIDYDNLDLTTNIKAHALHFTNNKMRGFVDELNLREKSGYIINNLSAKAVVGQGKALIEDIKLVDPWSEVNVKKYCMYFDTPKSFAKYISDILMELDLRPSRLGETTMRYLCNFDTFCPYTLDIQSGKGRGYVNDMQVENVQFTEAISKVSFRVDGSITGLPEIDNCSLDAKINCNNIARWSLQSLMNRFAGQKLNINQISSKARFSLFAQAKGPINRLNLNAELRHNKGKLKLNSKLRNLLLTNRDIQISADISTSNLSLQSIIPSISVNELDLQAHIQSSLGKNDSNIWLDSLIINHLDYNKTSYEGLYAQGELLGDIASINASCSDPKLLFDLQAMARFNGKSQYILDADFHNIDTYALGLDTREIGSSIGFKLGGNISILGQFVSGEASISDVTLRDHSSESKVDDTRFEAICERGEQIVHIQSPIIDAELRGTGSISQFIKDLSASSLQRELPALFLDSQAEFGNHSYELNAYCRDSRNLLSYLLPGLYIADSTIVKLQLDQRAKLQASISSSRLALGSNYIKDAHILLDNSDRSLNAKLTGSEVKTAGISMQEPSLTASAQKDRFKISLLFDSVGETINKGEIYIDGDFARDENAQLIANAYPLKSYFDSQQGRWILEESSIALRDKAIEINDLHISNQEQSLHIDGMLRSGSVDTILVSLKHFELDILDNFLDNKLGIEGLANGKATISSGEDRLIDALEGQFQLSSLSISEKDAGDITLSASLSDESDDIKLLIKQVIQDKTTLFANGLYYPQDQRIFLDLDLRDIPVDIAHPFLKGVFDDLSGSLSGKVIANGSFDDMLLRSKDLFLNDAMFSLGFTGVPYYIDGPLNLDNKGLHFSSLNVLDDANGSAVVSGSLLFENLKDFKLDANASFNRLKVLDNLDHSDSVRGLVRANGYANVSGPLNALNIYADVNTSGMGSVYIPISSNLTGKTSNLLSFTEASKEIDPYELMLQSYSTQRKESSRISIDARLSTTPELKAYLQTDNNSSIMASFSGDGNVGLQLQSDKDLMSLSGDYIISEGNYNFTLPGIVSRNFTIQEGSALRFGGDISNIDIDVSANYKLKTSLSTLITDDTTTDSRRQVDCGIRISDRLSNPKIDFSIDVPDLDPTTKSHIESALSTEDKVQRQFLALLVMGSFIPDESSGVFNGSNVLLSNATELMSNQLNSIFQKLEIPIDVGIGYQTVTSGNDIFDVAISTQLFNDRVIVGGSVGNRNYASSSANGDVVGNLDIQIKLDPKGRYRLNLFSHAVDNYSSYLDLLQRNGVGINFQKGFKSTKQMFGGKAEKDKEEEMTIIEIENDD